MPYFDAMVAPVLAGRKDDYYAMARDMAGLFLEYGALQVVDLYGGDDLPEGKQTDLWRAVAADKAGGEGVGLGWIVWESKAARDAAWDKVMADGRMKPQDNAPMDGRRMIFGGFDLIADSKA